MNERQRDTAPQEAADTDSKTLHFNFLNCCSLSNSRPTENKSDQITGKKGVDSCLPSRMQSFCFFL